MALLLVAPLACPWLAPTCCRKRAKCALIFDAVHPLCLLFFQVSLVEQKQLHSTQDILHFARLNSARHAVQVPNITYFTDTEGNYEYFQRSIEESEGLRLIRVDSDGVLDLDLVCGWHFVFGGDSVDKGGAVGGSVRVVKSLLKLKKKYPRRVTLLLGNRDLNKMRLTSELAADQLAALESVPGPYWVAEKNRVSPAGYLRAALAKQQGIAPEAVTEAAIRGANTLANRLRWMLKDTMGADGEFERRQVANSSLPSLLPPLHLPSASRVFRIHTLSHELRLQAELGAINGSEATEAETAASFVDSVKPGGWMRELIELGELAVILGDTLYVHGGE